MEDKEEKAAGMAEIIGGRGHFGRDAKLIKESERNNRKSKERRKAEIGIRGEKYG
jgi:hypothetical protein